jgi:hypothetical protein
MKMNHHASQKKSRSLNPIDEEDIPGANNEDDEDKIIGKLQRRRLFKKNDNRPLLRKYFT